METHKAIVLTFPGMADICAHEIREMTGLGAKQLSASVIIETQDLKDIFTICYLSQAAARVLLVAGDSTKLPEKCSNGTVALTGTSTRAAQALAEKLGIKQEYKNPDWQLYLHQEQGQEFLCLDLTGDISKRDYRIFIGSETLKGPTAYALLRLAGCRPEHALLDPFCRAGSIVIEAALHLLRMPVRHYSKDKMPMRRMFRGFDFDSFFTAFDKKTIDRAKGRIIAVSPEFPSVQATRKNAKIAGVVKNIEFSRTDAEWLDLKFGRKSIGCIATQPPEPSARMRPEKLDRTISTFMERSAFLLSGRLAIILRQGIDKYIAAAEKQGFRAVEKRTIMQGKEEWTAAVLTKE